MIEEDRDNDFVDVVFSPIVTKCRKCRVTAKVRGIHGQPYRIYCPECGVVGSYELFCQHLDYLLNREFPNMGSLFPDAPFSEPEWGFVVEFER